MLPGANVNNDLKELWKRTVFSISVSNVVPAQESGVEYCALLRYPLTVPLVNGSLPLSLSAHESSLTKVVYATFVLDFIPYFSLIICKS